MHSDLERPERLQVMLRADEMLALDNWRFDKRMPSRAAAIRELLRRGLASEGFFSAEAGMKSGDYGVVGSADRDGAGAGSDD
jgi:hypothetical protein